MLLQWFRGTSLYLRMCHLLAGEFLAGGAPLNFIAKTRPGPNSVHFNSTIAGYACSAHIKSLQCACVLQVGSVPQAPRAPNQGRSGLKEASPARSASQTAPTPRASHPTFQAPWRHHYRSMCVQTIAIDIAIPPSSYHSYLWPAAGHTGHTSQGSRQFYINTPHSLSEAVPAALSSISNQAGPGTKAQ